MSLYNKYPHNLPEGMCVYNPYPIATQLSDLRAILSFLLVDKLGTGLTAIVVKSSVSSVISRAISSWVLKAPLRRYPGC